MIRRAGKFDGVDTLPMFDEPPRTGKQRKRTARPYGFGQCPCCHNDKAALLLVGGHLMWREHSYRTWSGAPVECRASGVRLCEAPARPVDYGHTPSCVCRKGGNHDGTTDPV